MVIYASSGSNMSPGEDSWLGTAVTDAQWSTQSNYQTQHETRCIRKNPASTSAAPSEVMVSTVRLQIQHVTWPWEILQSWQVGNQAGPAVGGQQNVDTVDLPWQNFDLIQNNCITVTQKNRNENEWTQCEPQNEINVAGLSRRLHAELLQQTNTDAGVVWASKQTNNAQKSKVTEN
jgi:hypothetical protein